MDAGRDATTQWILPRRYRTYALKETTSTARSPRCRSCMRAAAANPVVPSRSKEARSKIYGTRSRQKVSDGISPSTPEATFEPLRSRSEEHTSELQSLRHLVCRLLL